MRAGAALMVQPRAIVATPGDVVEAAAPKRKALPPAKVVKATRATRPKAPPKASPLIEDVVTETQAERVRRALANGPIGAGEFMREARLTRRDTMRLVESGAIAATGVTRGRRYALPGHPAKEAP